MNSNVATNEPDLGDGPTRIVRNLLREMEDARAQRDSAAQRFERLAEAAELIIGRLPTAEADQLYAELEGIRGRSPNPRRGGQVFGNVVSLFRETHKAEWSIPEVQAALADKGAAADPKAVHNAINYLARTGRLIRVDRGRYVVRDLGIQIEEEGYEFGTQRLSEHEG